MEKNNTTQQPHTEFDILSGIASFFRSIQKGIVALFYGFGKSFVWLFNIHIRYFFLFIILLAGLGSWAFLEKKHTNYTCSGETLIYCNGYDNFTLNQIVDKLNSAIAQSNTGYLSEILNMPAETCGLLTHIALGVGIDSDNDGLPNDIKFKNPFVADQYTKGEVLNTKQKGEVLERLPKTVKIPDLAVIKLTIRGNDTWVFSLIADTVMAYFNRHPDLSRMHRSYIAGLSYSLDAYNTQVSVLDSLQKIEYLENSRKQKTARQKDPYMAAMLTTASNNITVEDMEKLSAQYTFFYEDILSLVEERNKVQYRFDLATKPITVLSGFVPVVRGYHVKWYWMPLLTAILATALVGGCIDSRKRIGSYIKEQRKRR